MDKKKEGVSDPDLGETNVVSVANVTQLHKIREPGLFGTTPGGRLFQMDQIGLLGDITDRMLTN